MLYVRNLFGILLLLLPTVIHSQGSPGEDYIDPCASAPCPNTDICTDLFVGFSCTSCPYGIGGANCSYDGAELTFEDRHSLFPCRKCICNDIDPCTITPCPNTHICTEIGYGFSCTCPYGIDSANCEIESNECMKNPCLNGATCIDGINNYTCTCAPGYTSRHCEIDIDECLSVPCQNGATCTDLANAYACTCASGYEGTSCEYGTATRTCEDDGEMSGRNNTCIRNSVQNVQQKASALNDNSTSEDIADFLTDLSGLTNVTKTNTTTAVNLTQHEVEALAETLNDLSNVISADTLTSGITDAFVGVVNNLIDEENTNAWEQSDSGAERVLSAVDALMNILSVQLSSSNVTKHIVAKENLVIEVKKIAPNTGFVFPNVSDIGDYAEAWIQETSSNIELTSESVQGIGDYITQAAIYRNLSNILPTAQYNESTRGDDVKTINGPVVALSVHPRLEGTLRSPVTITFGHLENGSRDATCTFWKFTREVFQKALWHKQFLHLPDFQNLFTYEEHRNGTSYWSSEGCIVVSTNETTTVCACDHLTNFAVLMSPFKAADAYSLPLRIISIVGIGVSILGLGITMSLHLYLWRYVKNDRVTILMNLCIALLLSYVVFIAGVDRTESKESCIAVAAMLHYIYLVVFCIMLVEGIKISVSVTYVFSKKTRVKLMLTLAWFLPAVIVGVSLGVTKAQGYGTYEFCWLSLERGLIWAFVGPALAVIAINVVCLTIVFRAMFTTQAMAQKKKMEKLKTSVRSLCVLVPLMGVTWIIGIFHINNSFYWIQYMFAICNGLQGFFIFLIHCLFNQQIKRALKIRQKRKTSTLTTRTRKDLGDNSKYIKGDQPFTTPFATGNKTGYFLRTSARKHDSGLGWDSESTTIYQLDRHYANDTSDGLYASRL